MYKHVNIPTSYAKIVKIEDFFGEISYTYYVCNKEGRRYHGPITRDKNTFYKIYNAKWLDTILYKALNS